MLKNLEHAADVLVHDVQLEVEVVGLTIVVKAGSFRVSGKDYELVDDETFTASFEAVSKTLFGYLVKEKSTGEARLLVDEFTHDGQGVRFSDPDYEVLWELFLCNIVPADTASLEGVEVQRRITVVTGDSP